MLWAQRRAIIAHWRARRHLNTKSGASRGKTLFWQFDRWTQKFLEHIFSENTLQTCKLNPIPVIPLEAVRRMDILSILCWVCWQNRARLYNGRKCLFLDAIELRAYECNELMMFNEESPLQPCIPVSNSTSSPSVLYWLCRHSFARFHVSRPHDFRGTLSERGWTDLMILQTNMRENQIMSA